MLLHASVHHGLVVLQQSQNRSVVRRGKDRFDFHKRKVQAAELSNRACSRDLIDIVIPVSRIRIDGSRFQQSFLLVKPQRFHSQARDFREFADTESAFDSQFYAESSGACQKR